MSVIAMGLFLGGYTLSFFNDASNGDVVFCPKEI